MELTTGDDKKVVVDEATREKILVAHPGIMEFLPEAVSKLSTDDLVLSEKDATQLAKVAVDLGKVIGRAGLMETPYVSEETPTWFAYRAERKYPSHVALKGEGTPSETIALTLLREEETDAWKLITAFVGKPSPSEPFYFFDPESWFYKDEEQFKESLNFWMKHALVFEREVMEEPYESTWKEEISRIEAKESGPIRTKECG